MCLPGWARQDEQQTEEPMTMTERDASCEERIAGHLAGRLGDFGRIMDAIRSDDDNTAEEAMDEQSEYPLSVELVRVVKVLLSTGGPADWLEATLNSDNDITRIEYHFSDWFDHASRVLEGDEFDAAEDFLGMFVEGITLD